VSGRVGPHDIVAAMYRHVDDHQLPWLDELMIAAGLRAPPPMRGDGTGRRTLRRVRPHRRQLPLPLTTVRRKEPA
jgi:hypothetical protein